MIIRNMTAWFGALEGKTLELTDGLNILCAPNESGKSTWCAFVRAMLYGPDLSEREKGGRSGRLKYLPWSGAPMSGSMDVETPERRVTLRRWTDRPDRPMQAFSATVTGTDTPCAGLTADTAGEALTGMPRGVFDRTVFIRQAGTFLSNEPELDRRITAIASSGDEDVSFLETQQRLREWQRHRSGRRGAIAEKEARLAELRDALDEISDITEQAEQLSRRADALTTEYDAAVRGMEQARSRQRKQALAEMSQARVRLESAGKEVAAAQARHAVNEAELAKTPFGDMGPEAAAERWEADRTRTEELARLAERKLSPLPAVLSAFLAASSFLLAFFLPMTPALLLTGAALLVLCVILLIRLQLGRRAQENMLTERSRILASYGAEQPDEAEEQLRAYTGQWQRFVRTRRMLDEALASQEAEQGRYREAEKSTLRGLDFTGGDSEAALLGREVERLRTELSGLREKRAQLEGHAAALGDRAVLESERQQVLERLRELKKQDAALTLALETLTGADEELRQRYSPRLAETAAAYFSRLTGGRYDEIALSRELEASARLAGDAVGHGAASLSLGTRDQLYLALRLAVCTLALPGEDPCPLILDDTLASFDRDREARAMSLLRELARSRQVLLFTCSERLADHFRDDSAVSHRMLSEQRG